MPFEEHVPIQEQLLEEPIFTVDERRDDGILRAVLVNADTYDRVPDLFPMLYGFCNLYVRFKYGLAPNMYHEGGFIGKDFDVRNFHDRFSPGIGIEYRTSKYSQILETGDVTSAMIQALEDLTYEQRQGQTQYDNRDADVEAIMGDWVRVMSTLLRFDWREQPYRTYGDVWDAYCKMQDVLLNIMDEEELSAALAYARENEMVHYGSSF